MTRANDEVGEPQADGWIEVRVRVPLGWHELVAEALVVEPCTQAVIEDALPPEGSGGEVFTDVTTFYAAREDSSAVRAAITAAVRARAERAAEPALRDLAVGFTHLPARDYAESWKASWRAFRVGRLCIVPPWSELELRPADLPLRLAPGGSFGTGRHPTTRTCLERLQSLIRPGDRLLDAGSGSGVLAVASALLGAGEVHGFDLDPNAETAANDLARDNGVLERCHFRTGGFDSLVGSEPYDGVVANIYADVLAAQATILRACARRFVLLSGIHRRHLDGLRPLLAAAGLTVVAERPRGAWRTLECVPS